MAAVAPPRDFAPPEKALWKRAIALLQEQGVWHATDVDAVERYCRASAVARLAGERIAELAKTDPTGAYITLGSMKQAVIAPDVQLERQARLDADRLAASLGLTPASRRALKVEARIGPDPFAEFVGEA